MMRVFGIVSGVAISSSLVSNLSTAEVFQIGVCIFLSQACGRILLWYYHLSSLGGLRDRHAIEFLKYNFQKWYAGDPSAKLLSLFWATTLIFVVGAMVVCQSSEGITLQSAMFMTGEWLANPGAMFQLEDSDLTTIALVVSCGGLLVFALLVGIVSDNVEEKLEGLRTGKADVVTEGHSVVLGWTNKTISIVRELAQTYPQNSGHAIVVMSDHTKKQMESAVQACLSDTDLNGCLIVCRSGDLCSKHDLLRVSVDRARSVVILNAAVVGGDGVAHARQALPIALQVRSILDETTGDINAANTHASPQVVVEVGDANEQACVEMVLRNRCATVLTRNIIGRVLLNCMVTPLLQSAVLTLLSFTGAEIYVRRVAELRGKTFQFVHFSFKGAIPIGIKRTKLRAQDEGQFYLNPPDSYLMEEDDAVVLIADDVDSFSFDSGPNCASDDTTFHMTLRHWTAPASQHFLVLNWRHGMGTMLLEMDEMVPPGSIVTLFDRRSAAEQRKTLLRDGLEPHVLKNLSLMHVQGSCVNLDDLAQVQFPVVNRSGRPTSTATYTAVLILAKEGVAAERCDTHLLPTLIILAKLLQGPQPRQRIRRAKSTRGKYFASVACPIVCETHASQTEDLLRNICDNIVTVPSNVCASAVLAQLAVQPDLAALYDELLTADGCELHLHPAPKYLELDDPDTTTTAATQSASTNAYTFEHVMMQCRGRNAIAIGYVAHGSTQAVLNPVDRTHPRQWSVEDQIIVIQE